MSVLEHIWDNSELYQIIKGYPGGIIIFGLRGEILEVNPAAEALLDCPESALYERKYFDLCAPESNAMEAKILETQAFVAGVTELYEKKYRFGDRTATVFQHVYLLKNREGHPLCMVAMLSPRMPAHNGATLNRSMRQLETENDRLKTALAASTEGALVEAQEKLEASKRAHRVTQDTLAELEKAITVKDQAIAWKDAELQKMVAAMNALQRELKETKGALDVALIMSSPEETDTPPEENDASKDAPKEAEAQWPDASPGSPADVPSPHDAQASAKAVPPWEADDVVYDDDAVKISPIAVVGKKSDA